MKGIGRRGLFGLFGGAVASPAVARVVAAMPAAPVVADVAAPVLSVLLGAAPARVAWSAMCCTMTVCMDLVRIPIRPGTMMELAQMPDDDFARLIPGAWSDVGYEDEYDDEDRKGDA